MNVVVDNTPVIPNDISSGIDSDGVKFNPSNLANSLILLKSWFDIVVTSSCPVILLYDAVLIPNELPVVHIPVRPIIEPLALSVGLTFAPTRFATPKPPVEARETMTPPLGN